MFKNTILLTLMCLLLTGSAAAQQVIDISTGVNNTTGLLIPLGSSDDSWTVIYPNSTVAIPRTCTLSAWAESGGCSRWISPHTDNTTASAVGALTGNYRYRITFTINAGCIPSSAFLNLNRLGGDDNINGYAVNGASFTLSPPAATDFNPLTTHSLSIPLGNLVIGGSNTLDIIVNNAGLYTGLNICGNVTINFNQLNPHFSATANTSNPSYFTLSATATAISEMSLPGFGYYWSVEELNSSGSPIFEIVNPSVWWTGATNTFPGFNYLTGYSGTVTSLPGTPSPGRFAYNRTYRIRRGVWSTNCSWQDFSIIVTTVKSASGGHTLQITEENSSGNAPEFLRLPQQSLNPDLNIYPNPGSGIFTIDLPAIENAQLEVLDMSGKKVYATKLQNPGGRYTLDLSGYAKGMYLVHIRDGHTVHSEKIVLQ
ncbi:MAG: T9SS type A sorting domain-containing protein [Bacteroidia bacterium]|nr:T9SS type A sorting domain-containing protein [Bacteroidia bacterium]